MKKWNGCVQVNGFDVTYYINTEFNVLDDVYEKIQEAIKNKIPLCHCKFFGELVSACEDSIDLLEYVDICDEEPCLEDYDDEEEYEEALEEYNGMIDSIWDDYCIEQTDIDDPGDIERLKEQFVGKVVSKYISDSNTKIDFEFNDEYCFKDYYVTVELDTTGKIIDITDISAEGLESETVKSSRYGDCYPDFSFIEEQLMEEFGFCEEDE